MFSKLSIVCVCFVFLIGCGTTSAQRDKSRIQRKAPDQKNFFDANESLEKQRSSEMFTGSLWTNSYYSRLYDNMYRAAKVGDTITIMISEESDAESTGDTKADKKVDQKNSITNLGGLMAKLQTIISGLSPSNLINASTESKFQGKGSTERTGKLFAQLTATVTGVLKNGNMLIRGEKHIKVNKEDQVLIVEGMVRPYDILPNNTIMSNSLANAQITYSGFGVIAEKQSPGWLVRALDYVWPF